jgi:DNA-binding CsgD family transcriptional regulator/tetratricopeptide (TPR) repeat protein
MSARRLVGRDTELAAVVEAIDAVERGVGRTVLVCGEAGMGKSRFAGEIGAVARRRGFGTLVGQAQPLSMGLAYAPIVTAVHPYLSGLPDPRRARLVDGLPDLGRLLGQLHLPVTASLADPLLERTRMFEAVTRLFARMAGDEPLLLFVDDLHWADPGTVELLHYLARGLTSHRVLILGSYRAGEATASLHELVRSVHRSPHGGEVTLNALPDAVVAELVRELAGADPSPELLRDVTQRARGVPLFVSALVQSAGDAKQAATPFDGLPRIVCEVVLGRLRRLDTAERRLMEVVAIAGDAASARVLRGVWHRGAVGSDFDATVVRLVSQGLITEQATGRTLIYRVAHPLYAEVAYGELSLGQQRILHAACAEAIDLVDPANVLALAPHYRCAGDLVDAARASTVLADAGWRALDVQAGDEAVQYLGAALEGARDSGRSDLVPVLLEGMGQAYQCCGMLGEAVTAWVAALDAAEESGDQKRLGMLRHRLALVEAERGNLDLAEMHWSAGQRELATADTHLAIQHTMLRMIFVRRYGSTDQLRGVARQLAAFDTPDLPAARSAQHFGRCLTSMIGLDFAAARGHAEQALAQGERCQQDSPMLPVAACGELVALAVVTGDVPAALGYARSHPARLVTVSVQVPSATCATHCGLALVHYLAGDLPTAMREIDTAVVLARRIGNSRSLARVLLCRGFLLAEQGQLREAVTCLDEARRIKAAAEVAVTVLSELADTAVALVSDRPLQAPALTRGVPSREPHILGLRLMFAGRSLLAAEAADHAGEVLSRMREIGRTAPFVDALGDRLAGLMTKDPALLDTAAMRLEGMGAILLSAQARLEWAELNTAGDPDTHGHVLQCLDVFERGGVAPWTGRCRQLARTLGIRIPARRANGGLSNRETQVALLVGEGLSNAEIATRLFLSERTVETHLRHCYARLGLSSRVALARWAAQHESK